MGDTEEESFQTARTSTRRGIRGRLDIIADILELCTSAGRLKKTHIMQQANLSTDMTNEYLNHMVARQLIRCEDNRHYGVTEKGILTLKSYQRIMELAS